MSCTTTPRNTFRKEIPKMAFLDHALISSSGCSQDNGGRIRLTPKIGYSWPKHLANRLTCVRRSRAPHRVQGKKRRAHVRRRPRGDSRASGSQAPELGQLVVRHHSAASSELIGRGSACWLLNRLAFRSKRIAPVAFTIEAFAAVQSGHYAATGTAIPSCSHVGATSDTVARCMSRGQRKSS